MWQVDEWGKLTNPTLRRLNWEHTVYTGNFLVTYAQ